MFNEIVSRHISIQCTYKTKRSRQLKSQLHGDKPRSSISKLLSKLCESLIHVQRNRVNLILDKSQKLYKGIYKPEAHNGLALLFCTNHKIHVLN